MDSTTTTALPSNVPPELVFDFNMYTSPEVVSRPHESLSVLMKLPDIFYTRENGGHWVVTRQKVAVDLLQKPEVFSSDPTKTDPALVMTAVRRIPLDLDPPVHAAYRKVLNSMFSPRAVRDHENTIRAHAIGLVDARLAGGECEFLTQVAQRYPPEIFLGLLGIPIDRRDTFVSWVDEMVRSADPQTARSASARVASLMSGILVERRTRPGTDIISRLLRETIDDRPLSEEELVGITVLLFIGGLDTVVALLSFIMLFLAEHPEHRRQLVDDPSLIADAVEEMTRRFSIACVFRYVAVDTNFAGVEFKASDRVLLMHSMYGVDEREVADPLTVDFKRPVSRHTAFGAGPHRCLGSHLARLELRVFLEEWLKRIPEFWIPEGESIQYRGGKIIQPLTLPLQWRRA